MGDVYLAEQKEPIKRQVALKVIKLGMDTNEVITRFESERQALAMMNHPNVARIFDAGSTENGRPYFVMEHVPGEPITDYCDKHKCDIKQRLELFKQVCLAIHHAHQKGIIHRDIKPSNVLVTLQDGKPVPKVIDFGVAKATQQSLTEKTLFTEQGKMIGTPAYMSPEQAEMTGMNIDTTSDVYSLGVLLYEILVGSLPFEKEKLLQAGVLEMHRIIREVEPPRPSTKISSYGQEAVEQAHRRGLEPASWAKQVRGELEWITLRAMEKDRARRYQSASSIADDVERYQMDEAILAGPPSVTYQLSKLVARHKGPVAFAVTVLILLLGFGISMGFLRESAERAREEAQTRAQELELVTEFQASMLSGIDVQEMGKALVGDLRDGVRTSLEADGVSLGNMDSTLALFDQTIRRANATDVALGLVDEHVLGRAVEAIEADFSDQPLVQAALQQTVAITYKELGLYPLASPLQESALETNRRILGDEHPETLNSISYMGSLLRSMGKYDEALVYYQEALDGSRRVLGQEHQGTLASTNNMGALLRVMGKYDEALVYCREALEGRRRVLGDDHRATLTSINNMGVLLRSMGRNDEALVYYREGLEGVRRVLGGDHPNTIVSINNMGRLLWVMGRLDEALVFYREALEGSRRVLGDDHPNTLLMTYNISGLLYSMGKEDEALACARKTLEGRRLILGNEHKNTLNSLSQMGLILYSIGELDESLVCYREALSGRRRLLGDDHKGTLNLIKAVGGILVKQGKPDEAVALLVPAEAAARRVFVGRNARRLGLFLTALGRAHVATGVFEVAQTNLNEAEAILQEAKGVKMVDREKVLIGLVELYEAWLLAEPGQGYDRKAAEWGAVLAGL
ncbi:MAG: serine/threonine-protein kinase [Gemmatimonadales bacterium]|nr:serine/threonine-protein kinase [Gemmatimonadales bacterium]